MSTWHHATEGFLAEFGMLADPIRRKLYDVVSNQDAPVSRESAAKAAGISRTLAAYHLDKLAEIGLLDISYARRDGRTGPGAGRPAKRYTRSQREISVSLPPRNYNLLARILADAVAADTSGSIRTTLTKVAEREGVTVGTQTSDLMAALTATGYEPVIAESGDIILRNCPFHQVVQQHAALVCELNCAFIHGTLAGAGADPARAELSPRLGRCCMTIHAEASSH